MRRAIFAFSLLAASNSSRVCYCHPDAAPPLLSPDFLVLQSDGRGLQREPCQNHSSPSVTCQDVCDPSSESYPGIKRCEKQRMGKNKKDGAWNDFLSFFGVRRPIRGLGLFSLSQARTWKIAP